MIKRILRSEWNMPILLICWFSLLWARTLIGLANHCETDIFYIIKVSVIMLFSTFMLGSNLFLWDDKIKIFYKDNEEIDLQIDAEKNIYSQGLTTSLCVVFTLLVLCMLSFGITERVEGVFDLFSNSTYMQICWWNINKKYLFDLLMVVVFPAWSTFIIRKMKESKFSSKAVYSGCIQILGLTIIGFLLYMRCANIWLVELAVVNVMTLILAVKNYLWKDVQKKGNVIALLIIYTLAWIALLSIFYSGQSIYEYMGFSDVHSVNSYFTNVTKITENAALFEMTPVLVNDPHVVQFQQNNYKLIPSLLYHMGWIPTILVMIIEIIFMIASIGVIVQNQRHDGRDIILQTIGVGLFVRIAGGFMYSFGVPLPILLPFTGRIGIITDTMCMGILILSSLSKQWESIVENILEEWDEEDEEDNEDTDKENDE